MAQKFEDEEISKMSKVVVSRTYNKKPMSQET